MHFRHQAVLPWLGVGIFLLAAAHAAPCDGEDDVAGIRAALGGTGTLRPSHRCLTPLFSTAHHSWTSLAPEQRAEVTRLRASTELDSTYVSPSGRFSLHYSIAGPDSVPAVDVDPPNDVPDFVERCGEYADLSWQTEVDTLGFAAPALPPDGTYDISFRALGGGYYGYAAISGATTEIVLHSTFLGAFGWPGPTDDPDGNQLGRAKVTIAHEFKHASQFTNNGWTEGIWAEADAMWIEDIVFPVVNDYHYWVTNGSESQLDAAWIVLNNDAGEGNYEDCLWQHYISGTWGTAAIRELWDRRAAFPGEDMTASYGAILSAHGSNWSAAYASHLDWCWFTGSRAEAGFGFTDAADLWRMELVSAAIASYPSMTSGTVPPLAGHPRRYSPGAATGSPRVVFDAGDGQDVVLSLILKRQSGSTIILRPELGWSGTYDEVLPEPWSALTYVGILVTNGVPGTPAVAYTLDVLDETAVGVQPPSTRPVAHLDAFPNPTAGAVRFTFEGAGGLTGSLRIVDVAGRTVATLEAPSHADRFETSWNGLSSRGLPAPAGVYWAVAGTNSETIVRQITLRR